MILIIPGLTFLNAAPSRRVLDQLCAQLCSSEHATIHFSQVQA
jgi:hypothetical protein